MHVAPTMSRWEREGTGCGPRVVKDQALPLDQSGLEQREGQESAFLTLCVLLASVRCSVS